jgi:hypothetical protein
MSNGQNIFKADSTAQYTEQGVAIQELMARLCTDSYSSQNRALDRLDQSHLLSPHQFRCAVCCLAFMPGFTFCMDALQ